MNFRHFLLSCNPFWRSGNFLNSIGPSRSLWVVWFSASCSLVVHTLLLVLDFICGMSVLLIIKQRRKNANWYNMYFDRRKFTAQNKVIKQTFETLYSKVKCIQNMANYFIRLPFFIIICSTKETTLRTFPSYRQISRFIKSG